MSLFLLICASVYFRNDKNFEKAALSVYRQKNFFNRWKNKSLRDSTTSASSSSGRPYIKSPVPDTYRTTKPNIIHKHSKGSKSGGPKESIPLKDADHARNMMRRSLKQNMMNDLESDLGGGESSRSSWGSDMRPITHIHHHSNTSDSGILLVESSVQTDSDLLEMFMGLRRRLRSDSSNNEVLTGNNIKVGATINVFTAYEKNNDGFESGESDYLLSSRYSDKTGSREPETPDTFEDDVIDSHRLLRPSKQSLLGTSMSGESSPLLGNGAAERYRISCDSTSEESLSDRENHDFDELDDLLAGACPYEGSFGSIHKQTNEHDPSLNPKSGNSKGSSPNSDGRKMAGSEYMGHVVLDLPNQMLPPVRSGSLRPPDGPPDSFQNFLKSRGSVIPCVGTNTAQDAPDYGASLRPTASAPMLHPQLGINGKNGNLLPVSSDIRPPPPGWAGQSPPSPNSDHSSGHSEYSIDVPKHISTLETVSPDSLSVETNGSFQLMPSEPTQHSLLDMEQGGAVGGQPPSLLHQGDLPASEDSISKFQEFLKNRGVDLDMSVVQSSDV